MNKIADTPGGFLLCVAAGLLMFMWLRLRIMLSLLAAGVGFGLEQVLLVGTRFFRYFLPMMPFFFLTASIALPALNEAAINRNRRGSLPVAWALLNDLAADAGVHVEGAFSNCASLRLYVARDGALPQCAGKRAARQILE